MFSIVLDIVLADLNVIEKLGVFLMGRFRDTHSALQKSTKPGSKQFGGQKIRTEMCRTVDV